MIFVDANVPMYAVGAAHPNRDRSLRGLEELSAARVRMVTNAEVFQEILHRYSAINRFDAIESAFGLLRRVADEVFPIELEDVALARSLVLRERSILARDALHLAVMQRRHVSRVFSFDRDFDGHPGLERFEPD